MPRVVWTAALAYALVVPASDRLESEDCNANLLSDHDEIEGGLASDCNGNGIPDACDVSPASAGLVWSGSAGAYLSRFALGDLDGDGDVDLAGVGIPEEFHVLLNGGDGSFEESNRSPAHSQSELALADLDADGALEVVRSDGNQDFVGIYELRREAGPILFRLAYLPAPIGTSSILPADVDGDSDLDLAFSAPWAPLYENRGAFVFEARQGQGLENAYRLIVAIDADLDGRTDLVGSTQGAMALFRSLGGWSFEQLLMDSPPAAEAAAADLDGDGGVDLALLVSREGIRVLRNDLASASFRLIEELPADVRPGGLLAADLDGDGDQDLAAGAEGAILGYFNSGMGSFKARPLTAPMPRQGDTTLAAADLDGDGDVDVTMRAYPSTRILKNTSVAPSLDCDRDGIPDECGPGLGPACEDCDRDGIPDYSEILAGASDRNRNGILDRCEPEIDFRFRLRAPGTITDFATPLKFPAAVDILTLGVAEGEEGLQGWLIFLGVEGGRITGATTAGTFAGPPPGGLFASGYQKTGLLTDPFCGGGGAYSAVVLSLTGPVTLHVTPSEVLRLEVEANVPPSGGVTKLWFPEHCSVRFLERGDGEGADHPAYATATWRGDSWVPSVEDRLVRVIPARFRRGDANSDGKVDISDAIRTFMFLFLGASAPRCLDTSDANDDGSVDISDGLHILNDFFREGTGIPDPGPFGCGIDPTYDGLGCETYDCGS